MSKAPWNYGLALLFLAVACGPSQADLDAERARVHELTDQLAQARQQRETLETQISQLQAQNGEMAQRLTALGQNVQGLQSTLSDTQRALDELRQREQQAQARLETFRSLIDRFRQMIASGQLRVRIVRNRMVVELPAGVLFNSGSADLKPAGQAVLTQIASVLRTIPDREFQIAGHTDNVPIRGGDNWTLSAARAVTVARFLISQQVPANRLSAAGYADTQAVAPNDTEDGRQQNRRIEIALVPNLNELPDLSSLQSQTQSTPGQ